MNKEEEMKRIEELYGIIGGAVGELVKLNDAIGICLSYLFISAQIDNKIIHRVSRFIRNEIIAISRVN